MLKDNGSQKSHWFRGIQLLLCFRNALHIYALSPSTDLTILAQAMKHNACLRGRHQHCSSRRLITLKMKRKKNSFSETNVYNTRSKANLQSFCSSAARIPALTTITKPVTERARTFKLFYYRGSFFKLFTC